MRGQVRIVGAVLAILSAGGKGDSTVCVPRGYKCEEQPLAISGWFGGFDYLADGRLVVSDSNDVFILEEDGSRTIVARFEMAGLFGSFVKVSPDGGTVYVGESTMGFGTVSKVDLKAGGVRAIGPTTASVVAEIPLNYDMEFDLQGRAFVSAGTPGTWMPNRLLLLDLRSGETDLVAVLEGYSGPLAFDGQGNLFYCTSTSYPPQAVESVVLFTADKIGAAIGPSNLTDADGEVFVSGIYGFSDMVFDDDDDLFGVTSSGGIVEIRGDEGGMRVRSFASVSPNGATVVRFLAGERRFEPYYEGGGTLTFLESDFWSYFGLVEVTPCPEFEVISVNEEKNGTRIDFATQGGKKYQVYWSDDPSREGGWQLCSPVVTGVGEPTTFLDTGDEQAGRPSPELARMRFYRVECR